MNWPLWGFTNLLSTLSHGGISAVLNNHSLPPVDPVPYDYTYVYEDNGEGDIPGAQPTDSPGSLRNFIGAQGAGVWLLTVADNSSGQTGVVGNLTIRLDPQNVAGAAPRDVSTNAFSYDFLDVPIGATNLTLCLYNDSGPPLPVQLYLRLGALPTPAAFDHLLPVDSTSGCLSINLSTLPPLRPGRYFLGVFNPNDAPQTIRLGTQVASTPPANPPPPMPPPRPPPFPTMPSPTPPSLSPTPSPSPQWTWACSCRTTRASPTWCSPSSVPPARACCCSTAGAERPPTG